MPLHFLPREIPLLPRLLPGLNRKTPAVVRDGLLWAAASRDPNVADKRAAVDQVLAAPDWETARDRLKSLGAVTPTHPGLVAQEWLGFGYEPVGTIPCDASAREPLFDLPLEFVDDLWNNQPVSRFKWVEYMGLGNRSFASTQVCTLSDLCQEISVGASIEGGYALFSGELQASGKTHVEKHWEYLYSRILLDLPAYRLRLPPRAQLLQWLRPSVRDELGAALASEPRFHDFLRRHGPYYINGVIVGGHASLYTEYTKSAYQSYEAMQADFNASFVAVQAGASADISSAYKKMTERTTTVVQSAGGNTMPLQAADLPAWQLDVAAHPKWSGFAAGGAPDQRGLVSILELIDAPQARRRAAVWWGHYVQSLCQIASVGPRVRAINADGHGESASAARERARSSGRFCLLPTDAGALDVNKGAKGWYIYIGQQSGPVDLNLAEAVTDIVVVTGQDHPAPPDYTKIDFDLNKGCGSGSAFIYLCVERGNPVRLPINSLSLMASDRRIDAPVYEQWEVVQHANGGNADLNQGAGGKYIYLLIDRK